MTSALLGALLLAAAVDRGAVVKVLRTAGCDHCHDSAVSKDNATALEVYDLHDENWPRSLSSQKLPKVMGRLRTAPAADQKLVQRFIAEELRSRAAKN
jgi:hypothetical protein